MTATADSSLIGSTDNLEVRVFEARRVRPDQVQRRLDGPQRGVCRPAVERDLEGPAAGERQAKTSKLIAQPAPIRGVDEQVLAREFGFKRVGLPGRHVSAVVEDARPIRLL